MKKVSIVGFGRFGQTLYRLIKDDFAITIFNRSEILPEERENFTEHTKVVTTLSEVYQSDTIFFAVPINAFELVIKEHKEFIKPHHLLIDVLSVKVHPKHIFEKNIESTQILLTHPMFGPDSSKNGFAGLPIILDGFTATNDTYRFWKEYFESKHLRVVEMSAEEHDAYAAKSQGLTHFVGRLLEKVDFQPTPIDSLGTKKLLEVKDQTCNDTLELFHDLQTFNPYTKGMRLSIGKAFDTLYNQLLPKQIHSDFLTFGIQGGKGSFNEEALQLYFSKHAIENYKVAYLYTSEKVLQHLYEGNIDFGLFAISNATGGLVEESIQAMAKYKFSIIEAFTLLIRHFLMKRKDVEKKDITTIMAHPQVFKQCEQTLKITYANLHLVNGEGDLVDTAKAAEELAKGNLPPTTAILGPEILATDYNFDIIARELQDKKDNMTRFLVVARQ